MTDHTAEMDALATRLADASLIEVYTDEQGREAYRFTPEGEQVARQLAMLDDAGQGHLMEALLGEVEA